MGSAALQLCWVANGRVDAYYERDLKPWDIAAGALIAREGGATVELPSSDNGDLTVAATPSIFGALRSLL
jgi:myo-inositol-1(or 4)-monophosphatase